MIATGRSAGAALRMRSPSTVCWCMNSHSDSLSASGFSRMASGITDLSDVVQLGGARQLVELLRSHREAAPDAQTQLGHLA